MLHQKSLSTSTESDPAFNLSQLPKVELHVHTPGGTMTQALAEKLMKRHGVTEMPGGLTFDEKGNILFKKLDRTKPEEIFADFLSAYDNCTKLIKTKEDVELCIYDYLKRCHQEGAIYVELTCSPDHVKMMRKDFAEGTSESSRDTGVSYEDYVAAIASAIDKARDEVGIEARILMVLLRHNGAEGCEGTLNEIIEHPHKYVVGINLAGDEANFPAKDFSTLYAKAHDAGLKCTVHTGEHTGPQVIKETIDALKPERIGHGISSIFDSELMSMLAERKIGIEVSPGSNIFLGLIDDMQSHPFNVMREAGLQCSLNSDDPTFLQTTLGQEYQKARMTWALTHQDLLDITKSAIQTSFAPASLKKLLMSRVDVYEAFYQLSQAVNQYDETRFTKLRQALSEFASKPLQLHLQKISLHIEQAYHAKNSADFRPLFATLKGQHKAFETAGLEYAQELYDFKNNRPESRVKLDVH